MGFAPKNILFKSPTSIGLENRESTPNEKNAPKMASKPENGKPKYAAQMSSLHALIPIDEILNDIGSHVDIKTCIKWQ